jgi:hypothetical protein
MTKPVRIDEDAARRTTREGVAPMMNSQLLFMSEYAGRFDAPRSRSPEAPSGSVLRRLIVRIGRRLRPNPAPPYLSDHLCRDIGIEPMPKEPEVFWPW